MTKELSLFDTLLSTSTKSSGETKVSKEGGSLFDDLLKSATTQSQTGQSTATNTNNTNNTNTQVTSVNTAQPSNVVEKLDGEVAKSEQPTTVQANIVAKTPLSKSDSTNVQTDLLQPKVVVNSESENIVTVNVSQDDSTVIVTDKEGNTNGQKNGIQTGIKPKQETKNQESEIVDNSKNIEKQTDDDSKVSDNTSKVVQSVVSRTPSVLDKIQVEQKNKNLVDVESILKNSTTPATESTTSQDGQVNSKVISEKNNSVVLSKSTESNLSVSQNVEQENNTESGIKNIVNGEKPKQDSEAVKIDALLSDAVSNKEETVDLSTSLTTQNKTTTAVVDTSAKVGNNKEQDIYKEPVVKHVVVSADSGTNEVNITVATTQTLQESQQKTTQPIEQKVQVVGNSLGDDGSVIADKKQSPKQNADLQDFAEKTSSQTKVLLEETVVKNQEVVVGGVVGRDELPTKLSNIETNLSNQVQEADNQTQKTVSVKDSVTPKVNTEHTDKVSVLVASNNLTVDNVISDDIKSIGVSDTKPAETTPTNKQNAGVELAKLNSGEVPKPIDIEIDDKLKDIPTKTEKQSVSKSNSSLLDKLIEDSVKLTTKDSSQTVDKLEIKNGQIVENAKTQDSIQKNDIMENIYKSSVSKNISLAAMQNATMAKETLKNADSIQDIQKSADMLELNLESIEEVKIQDVSVSDTKQRAVNINRAFLEKGFDNKDSLIEKDSQIFDIEHKQTSMTDTKTTTNNMIQKVVELTVGDAEVLTIQNRIIGARQQLSSMMSDVARAMYENYKPPHTAFRISLNPANLGSIAILIRSQRADNSLSISMNMSSSSTLESVVANQNELRSALQKTFNDNSSFEFDFKLDPDASGSGFQNEGFSSNEQNQETKEDERNTFVASSEIIEEIQEVQKSGTYF
jgi:hypothetical protein